MNRREQQVFQILMFDKPFALNYGPGCQEKQGVVCSQFLGGKKSKSFKWDEHCEMCLKLAYNRRGDLKNPGLRVCKGDVVQW